ncbi:deaminase [Candidatus Woesearchaeota archaeon]|nr:deaminase [Candidatus Woesearchaeota archaeon]
MARVSWEQYFMNIAKQVATRSTCDRKHVGAVIVRDRTILSTGYNGSIRGVMIEGSELYITASPCWNCFKLLANTGVRKIYYGEFYRDERSFDVAKKLGIELVHIPVDQKEL